MKNCLASVLLFLLFASAATLHASDCSTMAGGVPVVIPAPGEFVEVGRDKRDFFEYMVPSRNRLLCAFVPAELLPRLKNPASGMSRYMVVEISRRLDEKNIEVTPARFEQVVSGFKQQLGDSSKLNRTVQTTSEEINWVRVPKNRPVGEQQDSRSEGGTVLQPS